MSALEILEAKSGRIHTLEDWRIAGEKAQADPASLTVLDFAILDHLGGARAAAAARARREQALAPPPIETKSLPAPVTTPAAHAALLPSLDEADDFSSDEGLDAWVKRNELAAVPVIVWRAFVQAQRDKRQQLEVRVAALEAKPHVNFCGTWKAGPYQPGEAATHQGGLWICRAATSGEPTKDFVGWQLAVKSGAAR